MPQTSAFNEPMAVELDAEKFSSSEDQLAASWPIPTTENLAVSSQRYPHSYTTPAIPSASTTRVEHQSTMSPMFGQMNLPTSVRPTTASVGRRPPAATESRFSSVVSSSAELSSQHLPSHSEGSIGSSSVASTLQGHLMYGETSCRPCFSNLRSSQVLERISAGMMAVQYAALPHGYSQLTSTQAPPYNTYPGSSLDQVIYEHSSNHKEFASPEGKIQASLPEDLVAVRMASASTQYSSPDDIVIPSVEVPGHLQPKQYDAVLFYSEEDQQRALTFMDILVKFITLQNKKPPSICVLDRTENLTHIQSRFAHSKEALERSTYMFLFVTKHFCTDTWSEMQRDECLMESIEKPDKKWCVIPILTKPRKEADYDIPFGMRALKGVDISHMLRGKSLDTVDGEHLIREDVDQFFLKNMKRMFDDRLYLRIEREKKQLLEFQKWLKDEKQRRWIKKMDEQYENEQAEKRREQERITYQESLNQRRQEEEICRRSELVRASEMNHQIQQIEMTTREAKREEERWREFSKNAAKLKQQEIELEDAKRAAKIEHLLLQQRGGFVPSASQLTHQTFLTCPAPAAVPAGNNHPNHPVQNDNFGIDDPRQERELHIHYHTAALAGPLPPVQMFNIRTVQNAQFGERNQLQESPVSRYQS